MRQTDAERVQELLRRLERLESRRPAPEEATIHAIAQEAIVEEISRLVRTNGLAVYRSGGTLGVVSLT